MNNVAGIRGAGIIAQACDDVLEQMVTINLLAPARLIQAALPFMKLDGSASIVTIGSIAREMAPVACIWRRSLSCKD